ncbi:MAG: hypothetical protein ACXABG_02220 [Promethearchaeota archaeon]
MDSKDNKTVNLRSIALMKIMLHTLYFSGVKRSYFDLSLAIFRMVYGNLVGAVRDNQVLSIFEKSN